MLLPKNKRYDVLVDGELVDVLLFVWMTRSNRIKKWADDTPRDLPEYDHLLHVLKVCNQAHTDLTSLNIFRKRHKSTDEKVQRLLQIATASHHGAKKLYDELLRLRSDT